MKSFAKRCLAVMLSIIMVLTMIPVSGYAEQSVGTFEKISSAAELTSGKYVMVVNSGYAMGIFDGSWITATQLTATDGKIINPDSSLIWSLTVSADQVVLTDPNGKSIKPKTANNGILEGNYSWTAVENNGTFTFKSAAADAVTLASNSTDTNNPNKFRGYKNTTVTNPKYSSAYKTLFTLYKLGESQPPVEVKKAQAPTASQPSGSIVASGTEITLTSTEIGAVIQYTMTSPTDTWMDYSTPIKITADTTIYAKVLADASGTYTESDVAVFNYTLEGGGTPEPTPKAATPTASQPSGSVVASGTAITLTSTQTGAVIQYTTVSPAGIWMDYSTPITITEDTTIYAKVLADKAGTYTESDVAVFNYILAKDPLDPTLKDPITTIPAGAMSIKEVLDKTTATSANNAPTFTVVGQIVYQYGSNGALDSAILEDVIDDQIYALPVYVKGGLANNIGDIVKVTGAAYKFNGLPQLASPTTEVLTKAADVTCVIQPQEFSGLDEVLAAKDSLLSEYIVIRNITLGTYVSGDNTIVTDGNGVTMSIHKAAPYPDGVSAGEKVDLYAAMSKYKTTDQLRNGSSADYRINNDTKAPTIALPTFDSAELGKDYKISVTITDNLAVSGATLTYTVNTDSKEVALVQSTLDTTKWEVTIPGNVFTSKVSSFSVKVTAKDKVGNTATTDVEVISVADAPQVTGVTPARNGNTGDEKKPLISITATNIGSDPTAKLTLKAGEMVKLDAVSMSYSKGTFSYTLSENLGDGRYTANVVITRADGKSTTYEWTFTVGTLKYSLYFGQLHSHTTYSDGAGTLDDALDYISKINESDNIDFVAFTDHSNYFDSKNAVNSESALYDKSLMTKESQELWNSYKDKIAAFNSSKTNNGVIALGGFEMTWSGGPGHINTYNTAGIVSRNNTTLNNKTGDAGMKAYYALLSKSEGAGSISQFNHPGKTFGTFNDFAYWDPIIDTRIDLLEVGNGEGAIGSGGYFPSYSYYTMALDKGWHVAPTNNQDNHKGRWGNANEARDVIITDDFTEQGIYDAIKNHRVYASEDKNLEILYTVNDQLMGSIIEKVPEKLNINIALNDIDDTIKKAELIANSGRVVMAWDVNSQSKELTAELTPDYSYYYVRVTQKDGDLAVTAPVWVGDAITLGISSVESSTSTPVTNEEMTIKTTLFNSETADATIKSLTYKLDGNILEQYSNLGTVAKASSFVSTHTFTPTKAKVQNISVEAVLTLNSVDYSFVKDLELDVRDANKLVYVGIDGSHFNEYVAGNYKDMMGNFSSLAAQSNVRCVILNSSDELIAAAKNENGKFKMLVLTAPSRRNGTVLREPYSNYLDTEIAAIKGFSEAGGTLVLCGWSDNYENYKSFKADDHMAAQQNKLLKAIGASLRISDDGTWDDVLSAYKPTDKNDNNKARLYLSSYNWDNALTKGIVYDANNQNDNKYTQLFSQYGGGSIYVVDKNANPTSTLPSTVSPIVFGHASTYSKDCDNDGLGGSSTPKYAYAKDDNRLMVLASETVTHANGNQSLVLVDGAAFMSNFEIQAKAEDKDTNAELNYANYTILQNLIQYLNPTKIDKISDVQKEKEEGIKFTVEGIVTSNASGFDKNTAFFDCIYIQDDTAGINAFPVAGEYKVGQKVRITGTTSSYQQERQLKVSSTTLVDDSITKVTPKEVTAKEINDKTYLGSLVKISGTVVSFELANGAVQTIMVRDKNGNDARIFIDGYITTNKVIANLAEGCQITAVGLSSYDNTFKGLPARIRIRDRADIVCTAYQGPTGPVVNPGTPTTPQKPTTPEKPTTSEKGKVVVMDKVETVKTEIKTKIVAATEKNGAFYSSDGKKIVNAIVKTEDGKRYILDQNGKKYVSSIIKTDNGNQYITDDTGAVLTGSIVEVNGKKYYTTKKTGKIVKGKVFKLDGKKYVAGKSGKLITLKWVTVNGKKYYCDKDGVVTKTK